MKKIFIFITLFVTSAMLFAQTNYQKGYVVKTAGDTLHGYINLKEWRLNPDVIDFKPDANSNETKQFGIKDISCFSLDGFECFKRYHVRISLASNDLNHAPLGKDTSYKIDDVFLKLLQTGKHVQLYSYNDAIKKRFYYLDSTLSTPEELITSVYLDPENDRKLITDKYYYSQLSLLANRYNLDLNKIVNHSIGYYEDEMIALISTINGQNRKHINNNYNQNPKIRIILGISDRSNTLQYTGNNGFFPNDPSTTFVSPALSVGFDDLLNPNVGRTIFRTELTFWAGNFTMNDASNPNLIPTTYSQHASLITTSLKLQPIYNFYNTNSLKIFGAFGFLINYTYCSKNNYLTDSNGLSTFQQTNFPEIRSLWTSVSLRTGLVVAKRIELFVAYDENLQPITTDYVHLSSSFKTISAGLNLIIEKKKKH